MHFLVPTLGTKLHRVTPIKVYFTTYEILENNYLKTNFVPKINAFGEPQSKGHLGPEIEVGLQLY